MSGVNLTTQILKKLKRNLFNFTVARRILSIVIFFGAWSIIVLFIGHFHQLPTPKAVFSELLKLHAGKVVAAIFRSFAHVAAGFTLAFAAGFPVGVLIGYSRRANNLLFPAVEMIRPIPPIAWIPLSVLFFVNVESQIIFLIFYGAFFPIVYNTMGGISQVDIRLPRAAMSLGVNRSGLLWKVILPAAMPQIFTGLKLAIGITWLMVVAAEMIAGREGLGYLVWYSHTVMDYPMVILGMGIIGLCGAMCSVGIDLAGKRLMRWRNIF